MNKVDIQIILISLTLEKFVFLNPRGARGGQNAPKWPKMTRFGQELWIRSFNFFKTWSKGGNDCSHYKKSNIYPRKNLVRVPWG